MPKSRKRKVRRGGGSSKNKYSQKRKANRRAVIIIFVIIAVLGVAAAIYLFASSAPRTGVEIVTSSGLRYVDEKIGDGPSPNLGQTVTVHYTGTLEDGTKFDSSYDHGQPFDFQLGTQGIIQGWNEGIKTMRVGGKRRLIVPPQLGYGPQGNPPKIPPNATLIFEVELLSVK
ncbi:MAG TPA: FKBP-type peptidyl-prolyl cis-trans isomerase [Blastocatellia bacterium]|nr:FKBP-type peptidyl-prolyl cis-trans isomerase [Blastocatellia bacterium]